MVKPIHARQGNSLAIGRYGVPTFVDGHGGHPERDVEGAVPYEGVQTRGILAGAVRGYRI